MNERRVKWTWRSTNFFDRPILVDRARRRKMGSGNQKGQTNVVWVKHMGGLTAYLADTVDRIEAWPKALDGWANDDDSETHTTGRPHWHGIQTVAKRRSNQSSSPRTITPDPGVGVIGVVTLEPTAGLESFRARVTHEEKLTRGQRALFLGRNAVTNYPISCLKSSISPYVNFMTDC